MPIKKEVKKNFKNTSTLCGYLLNQYLETDEIKKLNDNERISFKGYLRYISKDYPNNNAVIATFFKDPYIRIESNTFYFLSYFISTELQDKTINPPGTLLGQGVERMLKDLETEKLIPRCMQFQKGYVDQTPLICKLPEDILKIIYSYVFGLQNPKKSIKYVDQVISFFKTKPKPVKPQAEKPATVVKSKKRCTVM